MHAKSIQLIASNLIPSLPKVAATKASTGLNTFVPRNSTRLESLSISAGVDKRRFEVSRAFSWTGQGMGKQAKRHHGDHWPLHLPWIPPGGRSGASSIDIESFEPISRTFVSVASPDLDVPFEECDPPLAVFPSISQCPSFCRRSPFEGPSLVEEKDDKGDLTRRLHSRPFDALATGICASWLPLCDALQGCADLRRCPQLPASVWQYVVDAKDEL